MLAVSRQPESDNNADVLQDYCSSGAADACFFMNLHFPIGSIQAPPLD